MASRHSGGQAVPHRWHGVGIAGGSGGAGDPALLLPQYQGVGAVLTIG